MERLILELSASGASDEAIADQLTGLGHRSPMRMTVLPSTVKTIRLRHGVFQKRSQSHPRHIPGYLTVPQLAKLLDLTPHWIYDRIHTGAIAVARDAATRLYLFPDAPATLEQFEALKAGHRHAITFNTAVRHLDKGILYSRGEWECEQERRRR
jgi:hypothetical protein